ncbi:MAG: Rho termination factor N-terminal domain-containing protein [Thermosynechococcaceae cyanobacterium MS004]|nr:Rho termination factor N-terminal domain-containing protein [Thermosynechococcaceae cyanobacterium MS004]
MNAYTIPATVSSLSAALERFESAVYRADAHFQSHIAPVVIRVAVEAIALFVIAFIEASRLTYQAGQWTAQFWADYNEASVPPIIEVAPLALPASPVAGYLPATTVSHPDRERMLRRANKEIAIHASRFISLSSGQTLITPAPQTAAEARSAASVARLSMGVRELRVVAKERGIKNASRMSKATLQSLLAV